jgi:hypothetical protein
MVLLPESFRGGCSFGTGMTGFSLISGTDNACLRIGVNQYQDLFWQSCPFRSDFNALTATGLTAAAEAAWRRSHF